MSSAGLMFSDPTPTGPTATAPPEARGQHRDSVRLMIATYDGIQHSTFRELAGYLSRGDLIVVNDSATIAAEVDAHRGGSPVIVHVACQLDDGSWVIELRSAGDGAQPILDGRPGQIVSLADGNLLLVGGYPTSNSSPTGSGTRLWRATYRGRPLRGLLRGQGRPIAYGYLDRRYPLAAYQTILGVRPGSAEMASAARPFTARVLRDLRARGVRIGAVTLHTGVSSQESGEVPQAERFEVTARVAAQVNRTRAAGGRIIAVGTSATRALESSLGRGQRVQPARGWTERVVSPDHPPAVVDGLVTGWHDPAASHLLLVQAVAGIELTRRAYAAAADNGYLWHEFGDSCLFLPPDSARDSVA